MPFVYKFCHQAPPFFQREIYIQSYFAPCKNALKTNYVDHWVKAYCSLRSEIKLSPPDKVNLLLTNRGSTVAFNATFVPRSSIVFISDFDRTIFFPMTHGASSRLNVAEGFYRSGWLPGKPALPCQGAASDPLCFISSCHSGSPTHIPPAFNLGFAKNNGILSPKARGCPELDNSNNNSAKNSLCQEISCFTSTHNPLSAEK